jgi:hypothetical protein
MRVHPSQPAFTGGELSPLLLGRHDIERFLLGGRRVENFIARHQGPLVRRLGSRYVRRVDCAEPRLLNFEFSRTQAELLQFGCGEIIVGADVPPEPGIPVSVQFYQYDGPFEFPAWVFEAPADEDEGATYYLGSNVSGSTVVKFSQTGLNPAPLFCDMSDPDVIGIGRVDFSGGYVRYLEDPDLSTGFLIAEEFSVGTMAPYNYVSGSLPVKFKTTAATTFSSLIGNLTVPFLPSRIFIRKGDDTYTQFHEFAWPSSGGFFVGNWRNFLPCWSLGVTYNFTDRITPDALGKTIQRTGVPARTQELTSFDSGSRTYEGTKSGVEFTVVTDPLQPKITMELIYLITPDVGDPYFRYEVRDYAVTGTLLVVDIEFPWIAEAEVFLQSWNFSYQSSAFDDFSSYGSGDYEALPGVISWAEPTVFVMPPPNRTCWDDFERGVVGALSSFVSGYGFADVGTFVTKDPESAFDEFTGYALGPIEILSSGSGWAALGFVFDIPRLFAEDDLEDYSAGPISVLDAGTGWREEGIVQAYNYLFATDDFETYTTGTITLLDAGINWAEDGVIV